MNLHMLVAIAISSRSSWHLLEKFAHISLIQARFAVLVFPPAGILQSSRARRSFASRSSRRRLAVASARESRVLSKSSRDLCISERISEASLSCPQFVLMIQDEICRSRSASVIQFVHSAPPHLPTMHPIISRRHSSAVLRAAGVAVLAKFTLTFAARHDCSINLS
jgi:hypothetical protein